MAKVCHAPMNGSCAALMGVHSPPQSVSLTVTLTVALE